MTHKPPVVWCVGGSDSSAHTGLQADLRTGQDLGCHVQTIITCITAQNSQQVSSVEPVSLAMFNDQWKTLLDDVSPDAIKVSLLPSVEIAQACGTWLKHIKTILPDVLVVFDPVMAASSESGNQLQETTVGSVLLDSLLPYANVITPNLMELQALTGLSGEQPIEELQYQLALYFNVSSCQWLIKGGHSSNNKATDWLLNSTSFVGFSSDKLNVNNTRGTGCTVSTALANFLAHGYDLLDAMTMAKAYITGALKTGVQIGKGAGPLGRLGWPLQIENLPSILLGATPVQFKESQKLQESHKLKASQAFAKMNLDQMGLYPVVDSVEWLELVLKQGVKIAQLRIKNPEDKKLESKIQSGIDLGEQYDAQVFINDYWQQAIAFGAYGVHLGQEDLDVADLAQIQQSGMRLGISTHGYYEIARAQMIQPSYIALGHIFPTKTKVMSSQPQGLTRLAHYVALLKGAFPTVAIGGINKERLPVVARTGVNSVALVSAITQSTEPEKATKDLMASFEDVQKILSMSSKSERTQS